VRCKNHRSPSLCSDAGKVDRTKAELAEQLGTELQSPLDVATHQIEQLLPDGGDRSVPQQYAGLVAESTLDRSLQRAVIEVAVEDETLTSERRQTPLRVENKGTGHESRVAESFPTFERSTQAGRK
jgi:hypothetical protein